MKKVYKYPIRVEDYQIIEMPAGAQILTIQTQDNQPCIWALVDPDTDHIQRRYINIFGTGQPVENNSDAEMAYIGTFQINSGNEYMGYTNLVFHVFEQVL